MQKITTAAELKTAIRELEYRQAHEWSSLKAEFLTTCESLKPVNLIKSTFNELTATPDLKGDMLNTTLSLAAGYLSRKVVAGTTNNPLKKLLGALLQIGVTNMVSKNSGGIKSETMYLINRIFSRKDRPV